MSEINSAELSVVAKLIDEIFILEDDGIKYVKFKNGLMMPLCDEKEDGEEWEQNWNPYIAQKASKRIEQDVYDAVMMLNDLMMQSCVNGNWNPDWHNNHEQKWCIECSDDSLLILCRETSSRFLAFKDKATAEKFVKMYRHYIAKAAPILFGVEL